MIAYCAISESAEAKLKTGYAGSEEMSERMMGRSSQAMPATAVDQLPRPFTRGARQRGSACEGPVAFLNARDVVFEMPSKYRETNTMTSSEESFAARVRANQRALTSEIGTKFDYIICGAGTSGSVVAARLAANPNVCVLLLEAGGSDEADVIVEPNRWPMTLGSELD
jgi:hypothetical protein